MPRRSRILPATIAAGATAFALAALALRRGSVRSYASLNDRRPGLGPDGVLAGAEALDLPAIRPPRDCAVLLLHGFGDTPQSVGYLAGFLQESGYRVRAPLLPGHGRTLRVFGASTARQWLQHARAEYDRLNGAHERVVLIGQSMGGALATVLATERAPAALVLLAPYLGMPRSLAAFARLFRLWSPLLPYVGSGGDASIVDEVERTRSLAYGAVTGAVLAQLREAVLLARRAAPQVTAPMLLVQSHRDHRIAGSVTRTAFARFGSARKRLVWLDDGGHVLTADRGRDRLFALLVAWLDAELARQELPKPGEGAS